MALVMAPAPDAVASTVVAWPAPSHDAGIKRQMIVCVLTKRSAHPDCPPSALIVLTFVRLSDSKLLI
jgi:hypothetical protein